MTLLSGSKLLRRLGVPVRFLARRGALVFALVLIELLGRGSTSDAADLFWVVVFVTVIATWLGVDGDVRAALGRGVTAARAWITARLPVFGVDLRGDPAVPAGVPAFVHRCAALCALVTALELVWILGVGTPFRDFLARGSYVVLLLSTTVLWAALVATVVSATILAVVVVLDGLRRRHGDRPHRRRRRLWIGGYFTVVVIGCLFLPNWVAVLALCLGVGYFLVADTFTPLPPLPILWRDRGGRVGAFDVYQWLVAQMLLMWWPVGMAVLAGLGGRAFGAPAGDTTPVTDALATCAVWCAGPAAALLTLFWTDLLQLLLRRAPAARCETSVHITPDQAVGPEERRRAEERLAARGWRVHWHPSPPESADVKLRLVATMPRPRGRHGRWPLAVSANALTAPELLDLIARRDVVQRRRLLLRGLGRMMKRARRRSYAVGTGFWIAPQYWFVIGLTRDTDDESREDATYDDSMIGEPYHLVLPRAARRHAYEIFRAVEVDIVFVEDGVTWRSLRAVLRRLFEHVDKGRGRIEERHLQGFTGVRIIVHDLEIGEPLGRDKYPEPDYEDLGRARVLHVFKDRGADEDPIEAPPVDEGVFLGA